MKGGGTAIKVYVLEYILQSKHHEAHILEKLEFIDSISLNDKLENVWQFLQWVTYLVSNISNFALFLLFWFFLGGS